MRDATARLRQNLARFPGAPRAADALASTFDRWREHNFPERRAALAKIAAASGWSGQLLDESIDALLAPFSRDALASLASTIVPRARVGGFIMPANVPGAGMHELAATLISGAAAIVKTSHREPVFFREFAQTLRKIDPTIGSQLEVTTFGRKRADLTRLMNEECDFIVALGDDASLAHLTGAARLFGFGSRTSGALISLATPANLPILAAAIARDVTLFEQQGCLSPHHIFIEDGDDVSARDFARFLADALTSLAATLSPAKLSFHTAAAIRRLRERARWRGIGAHRVELFEGADVAWTVVFDPSARFTISPGYRTVTVSLIRDGDDFASRLAPVAGRLEAFALAAPAPSRARFLDVLAGAGVTYVCDPGKMQSPPPNWPHGGGAFLDFMAARDE
jgi:Acyl-CoA reductase (LuxC)